MKNSLHTQFALLKPLGSVAPVLLIGKNGYQDLLCRSEIYSSTNAKMSVLYFFAMFVMCFPKGAGTLVEVV
jgi:hypothetical protein